MGCGNCSSGTGGKPGGCKGNGGCSTGGCNRLNVYDWLNALPLHDAARPFPIIELSFNKGSRKEFFRNNTNHIIEKGDWMTVEGTGGYDIGQVSLTGELVKLQLKKYGVKEAEVTKRVLRPASDEELETLRQQKDREAELLIRSRAIARSLNLEMKLCEVEVQADSKKGTFFYTADQRVDFRELIRVYATDFKMKIEMRQIGARQESGKVGGIGSCGRELCCSTWLTDFKSVNTTAARYQNLSINQTKLSGQCGRLKCCLNYELDTYMDALSIFPDNADSLDTVGGTAYLQKRDIFKSLMWYSYPGNNKQYPLAIARVKEILAMNRQGQKAEELKPIELEAKDTKEGVKVDVGFVNDVGQITLKALEKKNSGKKKKQQGKGDKQDKPQQAAAQQGGGQQRNKGQQQGGDKPAGAQAQGGRPQQQRGQNNPQQQGGRPQQRPQGQPKPGDAPAGDGAQQPRQQQQRPQNNQPRQGENAGGEGAQQNRPPRQQRPQGQPRQGDNAGGEGAQQPRPQQSRPQNNQPNGGENAPEGQQRSRDSRPPRPQGNRPQQARPPRPDGQAPGGPAEGGQQARPQGTNQRPPRGPRPPQALRNPDQPTPPTEG